MKTNTILLSALALVAAAPLAARADEPGKHPAYLHAISDLREARAQLEHPNRISGTWDEKQAIDEIDGAIKELKTAAVDDGKNVDEHPPVDAKLDWGGRLKHAEELLMAAYDDIDKHEDDKFARGLKARELKRIKAADELIKRGLEEQANQSHGPGDHPSYLKGLADLRDARAQLERPADVRTTWDEKRAIGEIDAAIKEIKAAAIDDGKNLDEHPPVDTTLDWGGRLKHAHELLRGAADDIDKHEDNKFSNGLKRRALNHITAADQLVLKGMKVKWEHGDHDHDHGDHDHH